MKIELLGAIAIPVGHRVTVRWYRETRARRHRHDQGCRIFTYLDKGERTGTVTPTTELTIEPEGSYRS